MILFLLVYKFITICVVYTGCNAELGVAGVESGQGRRRVPRTAAGRRLVRFHRQSHDVRAGGLGQQQQQWRVRTSGYGHARPRNVRRNREGAVRRRAQLLAAPTVVPRLAVVPQQGAVEHIARASGARGHRRHIRRRDRHPDVEGGRAR